MRSFIIYITSAAVICLLIFRCHGQWDSNSTDTTSNDLAIDASWDFSLNGDNVGVAVASQGWADGMPEFDMQILVTVKNGALSGLVTGERPNLASPLMQIEITQQHYCAIRMSYIGPNVLAAMVLRSGPLLPDSINYVGFQTFQWEDDQQPLAVSGSSSASTSLGISNTVDNDLHTYYESNGQTSGVNIIYDLGEFRWVTSISITPVGGTMSPQLCVLQKSTTALGMGPFETVTQFTLGPTADISTISTQVIKNFSERARYWQLIILSNYGASSVGIREVQFKGITDTYATMPFTLDSSGNHAIYYLPIHEYISGPLLRMRLDFYTTESLAPISLGGRPTHFSIDFIRLVRAPDVRRVTGCVNLYYANSTLLEPVHSSYRQLDLINGVLPLYSYVQRDSTLPYATTYDCPLQGGVELTVEGINFGSKPRIFVADTECMLVSFTPASVLVSNSLDTAVCILPGTSTTPQSPGVTPGLNAMLRVQNGALPGLYHELRGVTYRNAPPPPLPPFVTNIGSHKVDLIWSPPEQLEAAMVTTGYKIIWFQPQYSSRVNNMTVGNVTTTSVRGLAPGTEYVFAIAAMSEGVIPENAANYPTDLYGRREMGPNGFLGTFSEYTNVTATLPFEFEFAGFNANLTLNGSAASGNAVDYQKFGPTGIFGSEGHYGLYLLGTANVQNCNRTSSCCDGFDPSVGVASCSMSSLVCVQLLDRMFNSSSDIINDILPVQVPSNLPLPFPYGGSGFSEIAVMTMGELLSMNDANAKLPNAACGPGLRLTPSEARSTGAAWYRRKMNVGEGFDTTFKYEISNPSLKCNVMDDVNTFCRSRGADGFAFLIQRDSPAAIGIGGEGLGYAGIENALAVEIDTYFNYEQLDDYENHISIITPGFRYAITSNHSRALATTARVPDLTEGVHKIRIRYDPNFDATMVMHQSFMANSHSAWFMQNADYPYGGVGDWGSGMGMLYVYIDDLYSPVITTPIDLESTLKLDHGRAYVGFTAATGEDHWQVHDILSWQFSSLYIDKDYSPPVVVNGEGGYECVREDKCVHPVDHEHFLRTSNIWGAGFDTTAGWQTGLEGFCSTC